MSPGRLIENAQCFDSSTDASVRFYMLSALETVNGALLFGISTAFLFAVIQVHWQLLSRRHEAPPPVNHPPAGGE
jgi:hypothetical protein